MAIEFAFLKPEVDAIIALASGNKRAMLKRGAEKAVREAIVELLLANPNESVAEAKIAAAKAAGILSRDILLAEQMLGKVRNARKSIAKRSAGAKQAAKKFAPKKPSRRPSKLRG